MEEEPEKPKEKPSSTVLVFGEYENPPTEELLDKGLYNVLKLRDIYMPHTFGRHEHKRFKKLELHVIERIANKLALTKKAGGRKAGALKVVRKALQIVKEQTKDNPMKAVLMAIQNSAPREDTTRISYGGVVYFQSVDISPSRRMDVAIRNIVEGARQKSHKSPVTIEQALAEEIILASRKDPKSYAVSRKEELERHAEASR